MIRPIITWLLVLSLCGCFRSAVIDDLRESEIEALMEALEPDEALQRDEAFGDALNALQEFAGFEFDKYEFEECDGDSLVSLDERRPKSAAVLTRVQQLTDDLTGDEVFSLLIEIGRLSDNELRKKLQIGQDKSSNLTDQVLVELIFIAAERDSVDAINEIGAMHLYCYQGVEQNIEEAVTVYKQAVLLGDELAQYSLGKIYYQGLGGYHFPEAGIALQDEAFEAQIENLRAARAALYKAEQTD